MLDDPTVFVTCEIAPAVRVGIGKEMGLPTGENSMARIVSALHRMGFDQVYDTSTGADLTVIEEANEFVDRLQNGGTWYTQRGQSYGGFGHVADPTTWCLSICALNLLCNCCGFGCRL
jgi:iron only hydrogenase large subunit-like protein